MRSGREKIRELQGGQTYRVKYLKHGPDWYDHVGDPAVAVKIQTRTNASSFQKRVIRSPDGIGCSALVLLNSACDVPRVRLVNIEDYAI
jgi:hypothetical protein